jgi:hypothetical protein
VREALQEALVALVVLDAAGVLEVPAVRAERADAEVLLERALATADSRTLRDHRLAAAVVAEADEERLGQLPA